MASRPNLDQAETKLKAEVSDRLAKDGIEDHERIAAAYVDIVKRATIKAVKQELSRTRKTPMVSPKP